MVAQGKVPAVEALAAEFADLGARVVPDRERGRGRALNAGLEAVRGPIVLVTDDDCVVASGWLERALAVLIESDRVMVTGPVLTHGDAGKVPGLKEFPESAWLGNPDGFGRLAGGNIAAMLADLRALDGFDERIDRAAEDNDLCFRWLQTGGRIRYDAGVTIWHDDWRDDEALRGVYRNYGWGQGAFYGKYLGAGDLRFLALILRDVVASGARFARTVSRGERPSADVRSGWFAGMLAGLAAGVRSSRREVPPGWRIGSSSWLRRWCVLRARALARRVGTTLEWS